jgi:hypothetical protein
VKGIHDIAANIKKNDFIKSSGELVKIEANGATDYPYNGSRRSS